MCEPKTTADITEGLVKPFPKTALKTRPGDGGKKAMTYVDGTTVFRRLIDATGNNFSVEVIDQEIRDFGSTSRGAARLLLIARVRITIPGMGSREHVGVQVVNADSGGEDLWKGAVTDAIKKAATLFGVGLELYGPDYEAGEIAAPPQPAPRAPQTPRNAPQPANTAPTSSVTHDAAWSAANTAMYMAARTHNVSKADIEAFFHEKGIASPNDATTDQLGKLTALIEGKADERAIAAFRGWLDKRQAQQAHLMPTPEEVPNPDRHTR